jgi:LPS export ABC transporter protein LptC
MERWRRKISPRGSVTLALLCVVATSQGCGRSTDLVDDRPPPFSFRALDLQQQTSEGLPAWSLLSPEARYDLRSSVARALRPEGVIFEKGKPRYKLAATTGTVINDGEVILLEGEIRLRRLGPTPLLITADRALWIPRDSLMRFELAPEVRNPQNRLTSQTATLHLDRDVLQLRGEPRLEHWSRPFGLGAKGATPTPEILGRAKEVDWRPGTGDLTGVGPITITRRPPGTPARRPPQLLTASRLEGNTVKQLYVLQGPVQVDDPEERSWFRGGALTINPKEQWLTSAAAFQAKRGQVEVEGEELRLDGKGTLATIGRDCKLQQGGDGLRSQRCQWNWQTQAVEAEGEVVFQREANDLRTQAHRLQGQLGRDGHIEAFTPGGRVVSQLRVPRSSRSPQPRRARPKADPIVF